MANLRSSSEKSRLGRARQGAVLWKFAGTRPRTPKFAVNQLRRNALRQYHGGDRRGVSYFRTAPDRSWILLRSQRVVIGPRIWSRNWARKAIVSSPWAF